MTWRDARGKKIVSARENKVYGAFKMKKCNLFEIMYISKWLHFFFFKVTGGPLLKRFLLTSFKFFAKSLEFDNFQKYLNKKSPKTGYRLHSKFKWEAKSPG